VDTQLVEVTLDGGPLGGTRRQVPPWTGSGGPVLTVADETEPGVCHTYSWPTVRGVLMVDRPGALVYTGGYARRSP
jgi:hypothetical protein